MPSITNVRVQYASPTRGEPVEVKTQSGTVKLLDIWLDAETKELKGEDYNGVIFSFSRKSVVSISQTVTYDPALIQEVVFDDGTTEIILSTSGTTYVNVHNFHDSPSGPVFVPSPYVRRAEPKLPSGRSRVWFRV